MTRPAVWPNPIHDERPNALLWSRANIAEAIPGVATALTWTFWAEGFAHANREIWGRLGLLSRAEAATPQGVRPEDDFMSIFFGRPVVNVDKLRALFGRMPGGDPEKVELAVLGLATRRGAVGDVDATLAADRAAGAAPACRPRPKGRGGQDRDRPLVAGRDHRGSVSGQ